MSTPTIVKAAFTAIDANGAKWSFDTKPVLEDNQWTPTGKGFKYLGEISPEHLELNPWYTSLKKLG